MPGEKARLSCCSMPLLPRTKIVCTLGSRDPSDPAIPQNAPDFVEQLARGGMSVARLNLSHNRDFAEGGGPGYAREDAWLAAVERVNGAATSGGSARRVAVLADLQGVKLRLVLPPGARREGWRLESGARVRIGLAEGSRAPFVDGGPALAGDVLSALEGKGAEGLLLHVGDGETLLRVLSVDGAGTVEGEVVVGGTIYDRKGVTFRGVRITVDNVLTEKDRHDLTRWLVPRFLAGRVNFVAQSFVRGPEDVRALRDFVQGLLAAAGEGEPPESAGIAEDAALRLRDDPALLAEYRRLLEAIPRDEARATVLRLPVVAKIETREAAEDAPAIVREADGVMVARGDLGLQCESREVPRLQKEILRAAARAGKSAIVATQMLDSMERFYEPRRPEASDVFNAVLDHADALMLSGETSTGIFPVRSVEVLRGIIETAEVWEDPQSVEGEAILARFYEIVRGERAWHGPSAAVTDHASYLAALTAPVLGAKAIVALTMSGGTARMVARFRPRVPVYAAVYHEAVARRLALAYGVVPVEIPFQPAGTTVDRALEAALGVLKARGLVAAGDRVVVLCGRPLGEGAGTNLLTIEEVR
jgi:pyruvate kinase